MKSYTIEITDTILHKTWYSALVGETFTVVRGAQGYTANISDLTPEQIKRVNIRGFISGYVEFKHCVTVATNRN